MANIRVDVEYTINDGSEVVFRSPADCSTITGLIVYYPGTDGTTVSKVFAFADAHGNNVGDIDHLFAKNAVVKVILDVTKGMAFVQNADTNAYLEGRFNEKLSKCVFVGAADTDLNDYMQDGWYFFASSTAPVNRPVGSNGWLLVVSEGLGRGSFIKQFWYRMGTPGTNDHQAYVRSYATTTEWGAWTKLITDKDIGDGIGDVVSEYLKNNPINAGATAEEAAQIQKNAEDIAAMSSRIPEIEMSQGVELDGTKNVTITVTKVHGDGTASASSVKILNGKKGDKGDDYTLTEADKQEIAELTAEMVDVPSGGGGGAVITTETITGVGVVAIDVPVNCEVVMTTDADSTTFVGGGFNTQGLYFKKNKPFKLRNLGLILEVQANRTSDTLTQWQVSEVAEAITRTFTITLDSTKVVKVVKTQF